MPPPPTLGQAGQDRNDPGADGDTHPPSLFDPSERCLERSVLGCWCLSSFQSGRWLAWLKLGGEWRFKKDDEWFFWIGLNEYLFCLSIFLLQGYGLNYLVSWCHPSHPCVLKIWQPNNQQTATTCMEWANLFFFVWPLKFSCLQIKENCLFHCSLPSPLNALSKLPPKMSVLTSSWLNPFST